MQTILLDNLEQIVREFKEGKVLVFPTETSYGIGCDAGNQKAVDRVFKIKNRPKRKPLLVVVPSIEAAKKCLVWNDVLEKLANKYWPGPLTIIGKCQKDTCMSRGVISGKNCIAVRVTDHPFLKDLLELLGHPLVATSANISDARELYDPVQIGQCFSCRKFQPDFIVDGGLIPDNKPTTLVDVSDGIVKVIRKGDIEILI